MDMIDYTLQPGTLVAKPSGRLVPVEKIFVDGVLVGAMWTGGSYRFGQVINGAESYSHGDCVLDTSDSRDVMVGMIMRHRAVGNLPDWRTAARGVKRDSARRIA